MRRGYADTPEGQVHYVESGRGEPVMLLHQSPRSSRMYWGLIPLLATRYRAIAMDMLGYGYSDPPPPTGNTVVNLAGNVIHVLDSLGIEKCHLFGVHTGAAVASEAAARWPERIGTLTLFAYPFIDNEEERKLLIENRQGEIPTWVPAADGSHLLKIWMRAYGDVIRVLMHTAKPPSPDFYRSPESLTSPAFAPSPSRAPHRFVTPEQLRFIERWFIDYMDTKEHIGQVYQSLYTRDSKVGLPLIQAPTLSLDPDTPYEVYKNLRGKQVAELIPHCELVKLPSTDENAAEFNPPVLAKAMLDFLRKHPLSKGKRVGLRP